MTYQEQSEKKRKKYEKEFSKLFSIQPVIHEDKINLQDLSKQKREYLKNVSLQSYLQSKKLQKMFSPFSDTDKDAFVNMLDCYPFDPNMHGIGSWLRSGVRKIRETLKKKISKPKPEVCPVVISGGKRPAPETKPEVCPVVISGGKRPKKTGGGGGTYSPETKTYTSPSGEKMSMAESEAKKLGAEIITEQKAAELEKAERQRRADKLRLGTAVVSAYEPKTEAEIKESKRLMKQLKQSQLKEKFLGFTEPLLPHIDLTTEFGTSGAWRRGGVSIKGKPPILVQEPAWGMPEASRKETILLAPPTTERLTELGYHEEVAEREMAKAEIRESFKLETTAKKLQEQVNTGKIGIEEATKKLEEEKTKAEERLRKKQEETIKEAEKRIGRRQLGAKFASSFSTASVYGLIGGLAPPVGVAMMGLGTAQAALQYKEIGEYAKKYPLSFGVEVGGMLAGGLAGGFAGAKFRGKFIEAPRIRSAIDKSKIDLKYKQLTTNKQVKQLQISPEGKAYLQQLIDRGNIIRRATAKLKASSPADKKYLPNVQSEFIEVLTRDGRVLERISLGEFIARYKGKTFSSDIISDAVGKLNEGKYFTRVFVSKGKKGFKPVKYYEFLEKGKVTGLKEKGKYKIVKGETEVSLLKQIEKPRPEEITRILRIGKPSEEQVTKMLKDLRGEPYGKGEFFYAGKGLIKKSKLLYRKDMATRWQELIGGKYAAEYGYGKGIFEKIVKTTKRTKLKKVKPFALKEEIIKPIKKYPKPKFKGGQELVYVREFPYQAPLSTYQALTYEQAYAGIPKMIQPSISGLSLQSFLIGGLSLKSKQKQIQINLAKLSQPIISAPKEEFLMKQPQVQIQPQQVKQVQQTKQITKLLLGVTAARPTPKAEAPLIKTEAIFPPIRFPIEFKLGLKRKKKKVSKRLKPQPKAYQASVGSILLGYEASPEELKKLEKRTFTGLELRPIIKSNRRKNMETEKLRQQQNLLLEPAIGTAKKGSPRKAVRDLRHQYERNLREMMSYIKLDKKRSRVRKRVKPAPKLTLKTSSSRRTPKTYNPLRQGEKRDEMLRRLQKIFGFNLIKRKQKRKRR